MTLPLILLTLLATAGAPAAQAPAPQALSFGVIQGTVTRAGSAEPLADAQVSVTLSARQRRSVLEGAAAGATDIPIQVLTAARGTPGRAGGPPRAGLLTAKTDAAGHFSVTVPAGTTEVRVQLPGYWGAADANGQSSPFAIATTEVSARQPAVVRLSMIAGGAIAGRVTDMNGKPVAEGQVVALVRAFNRGRPALDIADAKPSDDRGAFRLFGLAPAEYVVLAVQPRRPGMPSASAPVSTFYPSGIDLASAIPVVVHTADDLSGIDIQMRSAMTYTVSGRISSLLPPGSEVSALNNTVRQPIAQLAIVPRSGTELPDFIGSNTPANADGTFEIRNVPAGAYDLIARLPVAIGWGSANPPARATSPWAFGRALLDVQAGNGEGVSITVHQGVDVRGRLTVNGTQQPAIVAISMQPDDNTAMYDAFFGTISAYHAPIDQTGSFTFPVMPEGHYRFDVTAAGAYVADVLQNGVSVYDSGLSVGSDSPGPIEVAIKTDGGSVDGTVMGADQKPAAGRTVVLVPESGRRQNPARYFVTTTNAQGRFTLKGVPPGTYKAFAWESVLPGAYENAEFMAHYEALGVAVTVGATKADLKAIRPR